MAKPSKVNAERNSGLQDDHDPSDAGQRAASKPGGIKPTDSKTQKPETPPDADSLGGGSQGGM
jgi:hypothetical protein